jgi:hypothetical protein
MGDEFGVIRVVSPKLSKCIKTLFVGTIIDEEKMHIGIMPAERGDGTLSEFRSIVINNDRGDGEW